MKMNRVSEMSVSWGLLLKEERNKEWKNAPGVVWVAKEKRRRGHLRLCKRNKKLNNAQLIHPTARRQASMAAQYSRENKWATIICKHIDESLQTGCEWKKLMTAFYEFVHISTKNWEIRRLELGVAWGCLLGGVDYVCFLVLGCVIGIVCS